MPPSTRTPAHAALPLALLFACAAGTQDPTAASPTKTQPTPTPATPITPTTPTTPATPTTPTTPVTPATPTTPARTEPTPDPITRPLDEAQARREASRLAEAAFAARKDIVDGANKPVGPEKFPPEDFVGGLEGDRWKLRNEPPAGSWARVSFGKFGERPEVEVGFASH